MKIPYNNTNTIENSEQGAVLIIVLLSLVLITIAGLMSVKNSNTDLRVATSDQVNTVLLQSADNINSKLEQIVNADSSDTDEWAQYRRLVTSRQGALGHFLVDKSGLTNDDIVAFCYRPSATNLNIKDANVIRNESAFMTSVNGYCDPGEPGHYTASRGATMTQLVIDKVKDPAAQNKPFSSIQKGTNAANIAATIVLFDFHTTSILPSLGSSSTSDIKNCVELSTEEDMVSTSVNLGAVNKQAMMNCMRNDDIVAKQLIEKVKVTPTNTTKSCTYHAGAAGSATFCRTP